jgi:hypothetical protein
MGDVVKMESSMESSRDKPQRFADFADEPTPLDGQKAAIDAICDEEITILAYRSAKSKFEDSKTGTYTMIQFVRTNGERYVCFTSSTVLARQCEKYRDYMPFLTHIRKICRYYTMT